MRATAGEWQHICTILALDAQYGFVWLPCGFSVIILSPNLSESELLGLLWTIISLARRAKPLLIVRTFVLEKTFVVVGDALVQRYNYVSLGLVLELCVCVQGDSK